MNVPTYKIPAACRLNQPEKGRGGSSPPTADAHRRPLHVPGRPLQEPGRPGPAQPPAGASADAEFTTNLQRGQKSAALPLLHRAGGPCRHPPGPCSTRNPRTTLHRCHSTTNFQRGREDNSLLPSHFCIVLEALAGTRQEPPPQVPHVPGPLIVLQVLKPSPPARPCADCTTRGPWGSTFQHRPKGQWGGSCHPPPAPTPHPCTTLCRLHHQRPKEKRTLYRTVCKCPQHIPKPSRGAMGGDCHPSEAPEGP